MKCPCGSTKFAEPYDDEIPINGTDHPMYSGGYETVVMYKCMECGDEYEKTELEEG